MSCLLELHLNKIRLLVESTIRLLFCNSSAYCWYSNAHVAQAYKWRKSWGHQLCRIRVQFCLPHTSSQFWNAVFLLWFRMYSKPTKFSLIFAFFPGQNLLNFPNGLLQGRSFVRLLPISSVEGELCSFIFAMHACWVAKISFVLGWR